MQRRRRTTPSAAEDPHSLALRAFHDHSPNTARPRSPPQPLTASHRKPVPPAAPTSLRPPTCIDRRSASPPVPPRFALLVTTPRQPRTPPAQPWQSMQHLDMPAGMPRFAPNQTPPIERTDPTTPRQRLMATHQDTPSLGHAPSQRHLVSRRLYRRVQWSLLSQRVLPTCSDSPGSTHAVAPHRARLETTPRQFEPPL